MGSEGVSRVCLSHLGSIAAGCTGKPAGAFKPAGSCVGAAARPSGSDSDAESSLAVVTVSPLESQASDITTDAASASWAAAPARSACFLASSHCLALITA